MSYKVSMSYTLYINCLNVGGLSTAKIYNNFENSKKRGKKKSISAHFIATLRCSHREIKLYSGKIEIWGLPIHLLIML